MLFAHLGGAIMISDNERDQVIQFTAGKKSTVRDAGDHGWTQGGNLVEKKGDKECVHGGDRIRVIDNMVFVNGAYEGRVQ